MGTRMISGLAILSSAVLHFGSMMVVSLSARPVSGGEKHVASGSFDSWPNKPDEEFNDGERIFSHVKGLLQEKYFKEGLTDDQLYQAAVAGMLAYVDQESRDWNQLLTPGEYAELLTELKGDVVGVGVEVSFNESTGYAEVLDVIPGTPAAEAGLAKGTQILKVDGKSFKGSELRDVVYSIRGQEGTEVVLDLLHDAQIETVTLMRRPLQWDTVGFKELTGGAALVTIRTFNEQTPAALKDALKQARSAGIKGLVIDLRGNPGGALEQTLQSIQLLVPKGKTVVKMRKRGGTEENITAEEGPMLSGVPLTVLVDGQTRSGAEFMAAALQQSAAATVVGMKTYGKWSAQEIEELPNGFAIRYTTLKFLPPSGENLMGKGLVPDIAVEQPMEGLVKMQKQGDLAKRLEQDLQLKTALNVLQLRM